MSSVLPVVLLAGGLGTRMREETEYKPKPMVEVGGRPVIWHIMKNFSGFNLNDFIVCTGYKGHIIKEYFLNYLAFNHDFRVTLNHKDNVAILDENRSENWSVTVADTGETTMTGGRVNKVKKYIGNNRFIVTYGDGLADVDIKKLVHFHKSHGKIATVTTVKPLSRFGVMDIDSDGTVIQFREKPQVDDWINIGFFVFEPQIFDYLDDYCVLEQQPLSALARDQQLMAFQHDGFWQPMDTYRESLLLNGLWDTQEAPWKNW
jgi:glucose-1-phosphate cytidylyltransferase